MIRHLRAFAEALFSGDQGPPPTERIDWLMGEMKDYLAHAGVYAKVIFTVAVYATAFLAPLFVFRLPTLRSLSIGKRVLALHKMEESKLAAPVLAVKAFMSVVYYEHPDVQREVGHVGPATFPMELKS